MPRVNYVIISWRMNFLAEGLLASMAPTPSLWVIHTDKTQEQLADFRYPVWFDTRHEIVVEGLATHAFVLDEILVRRKWKAIVDADAVVFLDHDCLFNGDYSLLGQFTNRLVSGVMAGHILSAKGTGDEIKPWCTIPGFAVCPQASWPCSWQEGWPPYDVGQKLASAHHPNARKRMDLFDDWPMTGLLHWGSGYHWMDAPHNNGKWTQEEKQGTSQWYLRLAQTGLWIIGGCDVEKASSYWMLREAVDAMLSKQNESLP